MKLSDDRKELVERVRLRLEEHTRGEDTDFYLGDDEGENSAFYPIVTYINSLLDEAGREVLLMLPHHRLDIVAKNFNVSSIDEFEEKDTYESIDVFGTDEVEKYVIDDEVSFSVEKGIGYLKLPNDFLKLYCFKMRHWSKDVFDTLKVGSDEYRHQTYIHSRGIEDKPQVAIAYGNLEIYSCRDTMTSADIERAKYIPSLSAEKIPTSLWDIVAINTAIKVEQVFGDDASVQRLQAQLQTQLQTSLI